MHGRVWFALIGVMWVGTLVMAALVVQTFEDEPLNQPPARFSFASVGEATGRWLVRGDRSGRHLDFVPAGQGQAGQALALMPDQVQRRFRAGVRMRLGEGSKVAGMVWRYQDPANYYQATLDLARQEVALYRVVRGTRVKLEDEDDLELDPAAWHAMTIRQDGERIRVYLGGIGVLRARTREGDMGGQVGVWAAAGASVSFDDLRVDDEPARDR